MAGYRPARGAVLETMEDFYKRRQREVAHFGEKPPQQHATPMGERFVRAKISICRLLATS